MQETIKIIKLVAFVFAGIGIIVIILYYFFAILTLFDLKKRREKKKDNTVPLNNYISWKFSKAKELQNKIV